MLALRLLGGLAFDNPDGVALGRAGQRRRLALLAVLASPAGTPVTRERLVGLLWPDVPPDDARHRLSVALYDVRQVLGDDAVVMNGQGVTLNPTSLWLDVSEFQDAIAREDWEAAVAAYVGPFLDAVYLVESPEFERWVEARRAVLARSAARALEHVAAERTRRRDVDGALAAWRRLTHIDPYSGRYAAGFMRALDAVGDRSSALRHAAEHREMLRVDLDADVSTEVAHLIAALKRVPAQRANAPASQSDGSGAGTVPTSDIRDNTGATIGSPRRIRRRSLVAGAMLVFVVLLAPAIRTLSQRAPVRTADIRAMAPMSAAKRLVIGEGDTHMRAGRFDQAVSAFERAVVGDSAFALAHFRLAVATLWADQPGSNLDAPLARAVAHRNELDEQNGILLDGFVAWRRGEWTLAEHLYRRALTIDTASAEARHQLGEVLLHYNTPQGRSIGEARAEFERVVALEPRHYGALWHLTQLAARDGRDSDVVALTTRLLALKPDAVRQLEVEALRAGVLRDETALERVMQRLRDADESLLLGTGWRYAVFGRRLDAAERVFLLMADPRRGPYARRLGHTQLFHIAVARGRRSEATAQLRALSALRDAGAQPEELAVLLAASPDESAHQLALDGARDAIARMVASQRDTVHSGGASMRVVEAHATLGRIHVLLGDSGRATRVARGLEQGLPRVGSDSGTRALAAGRAAAIRALQATRAGRFEDVIRWVDESLNYRWFSDALGDPHLGYSLERFLRAEALLALGRSGEADDWFATIGQHDLSDLIYLRPALLRRAEIAQRRGDSAAATRLRSEARRLRCDGACTGVR